MHILSRHTLPLLLVPLLLLPSCSETKHLAEGETLYTGIEAISWDGAPKRYKRGGAEPDSAGVITSIAGAIDAVGNVLDGISAGGTSDGTPATNGGSQPLTPEAEDSLRRQADADPEAFATAREEVEAVLAYAPNNALFGSSSVRTPLPFGLWSYNALVNHRHGLRKWMFKTFAANPVYVSSVAPETRARVATNTLRNYGFFSGRVKATVLPQKNPRKARVAYDIYAGPLHRLDGITYRGFIDSADSLVRATRHKSTLRTGDAFSVVNLSDEQTRLEALFRENGYYYYTAAHTTFLADTLQRPGRVQLVVMPKTDRPANTRHPWYIGRVYVTMRRSVNDVLDRQAGRGYIRYTYSGEKIPLRQGMWRRAIAHERGELFRLSDSRATLQQLGAMGVFSQMDVSYVPQDTTATCDSLDVYISATLDKPYDSSFEMNATLKSNQQVGPGMTYSIAKRNAFRGGEKVAWKLFGSYEWQLHTSGSGKSSLFNSYELGTELSLEFPRPIIPFFNQRRLRRSYTQATTTFALSGDWKNRANFFQMVTIGADVTYKWSRYSNARHELKPLSLEFDKLIHKTTAFDSIMTANPALYMSMRDQFIPSLSYTFTYASAAGHRNPVWLQVHLKEAGNVLSGFYAATGQGFNQRDKDLLGSPFAQFVKATVEGHQTYRIHSGLHIATRLFAGVVYSYGNSTTAPYSEQFYVGGANSVRAFTVRTVGPGTFRSQGGRYAYIDQTGDVKLEANAELRAHLMGSLHGAIFLDAGNVWLLRHDAMRPGGRLTADNLKNVAVGTGFGLRYDMDFLVLRFDVGIGLHAPYDTGKSGFYNLRKFNDALALHFAIGYPF